MGGDHDDWRSSKKKKKKKKKNCLKSPESHKLLSYRFLVLNARWKEKKKEAEGERGGWNEMMRF